MAIEFCFVVNVLQGSLSHQTPSLWGFKRLHYDKSPSILSRDGEYWRTSCDGRPSWGPALSIPSIVTRCATACWTRQRLVRQRWITSEGLTMPVQGADQIPQSSQKLEPTWLQSMWGQKIIKLLFEFVLNSVILNWIYYFDLILIMVNQKSIMFNQTWLWSIEFESNLRFAQLNLMIISWIWLFYIAFNYCTFDWMWLLLVEFDFCWLDWKK